MLGQLREREVLKVEAFVAWLAERGIRIDRTLVSHWVAGRSHLPADLLPLLSEFTERPEFVFGVYLRDLGYDVVSIPMVEAEGKELTDLLLEANAALGRLQQSLIEARSPASPGGEAIVEEERVQLRKDLDDLMNRLAYLRAQLNAGDAVR